MKVWTQSLYSTSVKVWHGCSSISKRKTIVLKAMESVFKWVRSTPNQFRLLYVWIIPLHGTQKQLSRQHAVLLNSIFSALNVWKKHMNKICVYSGNRRWHDVSSVVTTNKQTNKSDRKLCRFEIVKICNYSSAAKRVQSTDIHTINKNGSES